MRKTTDQDGCWRFTAEVELDPAGGVDYSRGVWLRARDGGTVWGIFAKVDDRDLTAQHRTFTLDQDAGGRDALKHFVRACHRRGIAVLMDMVFNHYNDDSARAAWQYSSLDPSATTTTGTRAAPPTTRTPPAATSTTSPAAGLRATTRSRSACCSSAAP
jgi:Alpha amylase, catalytic domain